MSIISGHNLKNVHSGHNLKNLAKILVLLFNVLGVKTMFIEFHDVSYETYDKKILQNISFSINKGEFTAILGANGSGKSTLAKLVNALVLPTRGKVLVNDFDTSDEKNLQKIRQTVGIVFQNPDNQIVAATVEDDIAFGPENLNIDGEEIDKRINNALKLTGLTNKRNFSTDMLSGGQKQKVAIAGALAMNPEAIIFDEATSMLGPKSRRKILDKIKELNKKNGITIIYITHFVEEILDADKIIVLENGKIKITGSPNEIFADKNFTERIKNQHLDLPFAYNLSEKLKEYGIKISSKLYDETSLIKELKNLNEGKNVH